MSHTVPDTAVLHELPAELPASIVVGVADYNGMHADRIEVPAYECCGEVFLPGEVCDHRRLSAVDAAADQQPQPGWPVNRRGGA